MFSLASLRRRDGEVERAGGGNLLPATSNVVAARRVSGGAADAIELPFRVLGQPLCGQFLTVQHASRQPGPSILGIRPKCLAMTWLTQQTKDQ
jgi:hypothetical protein